MPRAFNSRGLAYDDKRDYDRAIADFDQAIKLNPNDALVYNNRGFAYRNKGDDRPRALPTTSRRSSSIRTTRSRSTTAASPTTTSATSIAPASDLNKAIKINPNYAGAFHDRGITNYDKRDYDVAIPESDVGGRR